MNRLHLGSDQFARTRAVLQQAVGEGVAPGFVAGAWCGSRPYEMRLAAFGQRRLVPSAQPMLVDTEFDLASVTKVMGTASLVARLVDRGTLRWDTRLAAVLPQYPHAGEIEIRHLLSHTAGLIWWKPLWEELRARFAPRALTDVPVAERQRAMRELVLATPPQHAPGVKAEYSDLSFLLLGFALEELLGVPLDQAVTTQVFDELGLGARYIPVDRARERAAAESEADVAATEDSAWRGGVLQGQVHDDNCWAMGGYAGHAGAFGRGEDVLAFAARWLRGSFVSRATRDRAWARAERPEGCERTLGWDTPSAVGSSAGRHFFPGSVGHTGFTGTSLWIDPSAGVAVTLLSNRVHPTRDNQRIRELRPRFHDALREELASAGLARLAPSRS